ncbi:MAG TPA: MarR family transcriptional regulator [Sporichthyaceae bacterium]
MEDRAEPRLLDPDEQQTWLTFGYLLMQLPGALDVRMQRVSGFSLFEYQILVGLSLAPEHSARLSKLADFTASSLSRLSNAVTRLEDRGWMRRATDPTDGRYTLGILTDEGAEQLRAAMPGHLDEVRRLVFEPLSHTQQQQLRRIASGILAAVEPDKPSINERVQALGRTPFLEEQTQ